MRRPCVLKQGWLVMSRQKSVIWCQIKRLPDLTNVYVTKPLFRPLKHCL